MISHMSEVIFQVSSCDIIIMIRKKSRAGNFDFVLHPLTVADDVKGNTIRYLKFCFLNYTIGEPVFTASLPNPRQVG